MKEKIQENLKGILGDLYNSYDFDIKEFHHEVLRHGGIPLYVLEENINSWINQQIN